MPGLPPAITAKWTIWPATALRVKPADLVPGTLSIVSLRMHYWPQARDPAEVLADGGRAYLSRYALGRDYHKVLRNRLQALADRIKREIGDFGYRVFTDSAPVAEVALAAQAGLGWRGKHTLLLTKNQGSLFFLGELFTDLPLPEDEAEDGHCGRCTRCIDVCPTAAIVAPYTVDARRCISYLTIELKRAIPEEMRPLIGNRVYGCDDCQLFCPWNRFAVDSAEADFAVRHGLDDVSLLELFAWSEAEFKQKMAGGRSTASATSNGCPIWRWAWATRPPRRKWWRGCARAWIFPTRWWPSRCAGRWLGTASWGDTQFLLGALTRDSPSSTTLPRTVHCVASLTKCLSGFSSITVARAITVSPMRTGALKRVDCDR